MGWTQALEPRTYQIVTKNTHNDKILDTILTNFHQYYAVPVILPPVKPDNQMKHKSKVSSQDLPYMTDELKKLNRHKQREHKKNGKSDKFKAMKANFDSKLKAESARYINKNLTEAKVTNLDKANKILKRLAEAPGHKNDQHTFILLQHLEKGQ